MTLFKKIPFILVHLNPEITLTEELMTLQSGGVVPYCVIMSDRLSDAEPDTVEFPVWRIPEKKVSRKICEELLGLQSSGADFDQVLIYQDDAAALSQDIVQGIYAASEEPEAFHVIEMEEAIQNKPVFFLMITEKIFGTRLDEPNPFLWIIPSRALETFSQSGKNPKFFPLSWLAACHRENIPIRVSFLEKRSSGGTTHAYNPFRILFYSLGLFFRYLFSAFASVIADNAMFFLLQTLGKSHLFSLIVSRIFSMMINYSLLRTVVFREKGNHYGSFLRYIGLVIFSGGIVWGALEVGIKIFPVHSVVIKMGVELVMFFFNYFISKKLVFPSRKKKSDFHKTESES